MWSVWQLGRSKSCMVVVVVAVESWSPGVIRSAGTISGAESLVVALHYGSGVWRASARRAYTGVSCRLWLLDDARGPCFNISTKSDLFLPSLLVINCIAHYMSLEVCKGENWSVFLCTLHLPRPLVSRDKGRPGHIDCSCCFAMNAHELRPSQ
jgi:hypothetical protein